MSLNDKINADIKEAMKARETLRLETLRSIRAAILEFEKSGVDREMTSDDELKILNSAVKKRRDAIEQYANAGRTEAAAKEQQELDILMSYLPSQLSADEVRDAIRGVIADVGATGPSDFGKVMGVAVKQLKGRTDGSTIQAVVKELLG
ncbi:MAG: GatB/YqeY domain-containing protein [Chlorobi bacterium]|nr:MAG: GatB/YqeY domain-containing protein [Bacteroidota bacterium]KXK35079.1 MAG: GatB/Yqey [Chlorobi bacterium OLB6]MBE2265569.1 GatB/YqeY domain-containing protein [Flavobacteriales bacterium]MBL1161731.1 GatB/YqeY domain-containing protein [Chlorobiota bacterium]MBW7853907.1 GatB/YqeY domain-containing protein [Candidatus Kapabacteria bacterium]MCC6331784.1 GatB/YqeY domain-containing protein [Ignavibacteria bacterium]